ncbi:MAG: hypothetical protein H7326_10410 [Bdellovibrionaceae bacterium]|nr:hypothetical protein [Pseudobdellovibrionaceae bacterium]
MLNLLFGLLLSTSHAQVPSMDLKAEQISLDYLSSDGGFWIDCTTVQNKQPHSFTATCGSYKFDLHLMLRQYLRSDETTFEFHYWATETEIDKQTHTQSTWLTVDKTAKVKNIIGYLGFKDDSTQLRIRIQLEKAKPKP